MMSLNEAAKIAGKTVPKFIGWTRTFQPDYTSGEDRSGDTVFIYTDGDVGAIALSTSEVPGSVKIQMVGDVQYCDIDRETLIDISYQIESDEE